MSGLQAGSEDPINGVDVREQGTALRVATNTPHLVSLGTGRLSTAVTLHPIKQGRVTIGSDPTCDIYVVGTGVAAVHCRVENSHGVVTLYPVNGSTLVDGLPVDKPTRLSQGSMLTIGRSNYLRFNHPEEAKLMKSVLPSAHVSMAPVQYQPNENFASPTGYPGHQEQQYQNPQKVYKDITQLDQELDRTLKNVQQKKPPVAPRKYKDDLSDSDQEKPKVSSIMAKVSKFEYYAKQQKLGRSQFYTHEEISPKVFSSNSLTVNTPAKDVLGGRNLPNYMKTKHDQKVIVLNENNTIDPKSCSYANVAIKGKNKIGDIVRNFDDNCRKELPKKINNDQQNIYGKINQNHEHSKSNLGNSSLHNELPNNLREHCKSQQNSLDYSRSQQNSLDYSRSHQNSLDYSRSQQNSLEYSRSQQNNVEHARSEYGRIVKPCMPSPAFDRNPKYSPSYSNNTYDRSLDAETKRIQAYQERISEEEQKEVEAARLEEILNMCAEYERQVAQGVPLTPSEKRPHNKIITNGSLPRSVVLTNPNFVQTSEGYYKFDTSQNRNNAMSKSLPVQRNISSYENYDSSNSFIEEKTPEVTIPNQSYEGRMDEIGIPVFENELSSPVMIRKYQNNTKVPLQSPIGSPYENVYYNRNNAGYKPKSPSSQSPRTKIKTTFAHKNLPSPQYFVFPTPPPVDNSLKPDFSIPSHNSNDHAQEHHKSNHVNVSKSQSNDIKDFQQADKTKDHKEVDMKVKDNNEFENERMGGIEKQLSLEEEIPMIDDEITNEIEFRVSKIIEKPKDDENKVMKVEYKVSNENSSTNKADLKIFADCNESIETENVPENMLTKNKSFDDVKRELMADIPELEEFENDLKQSKRDKLIKHITEDIKTMDIEADSIDGSISDFNLDELREKLGKLKEERKKLLSEIHEIKCKMTEIRSQGDDILRELEMEKALIKGEYDSEIAILKIEQKKKQELLERTRQVEEEIKQMKEKQDSKQSEMRERVEVATLKVERLKKDVKENKSTVEELQNAQDILDNESKLCEDLEFQYLEEESELLAKREDLQNEYEVLNKKLTAQKSRILNLNSEANNNLTSALEETKILQAEYVRLLNTVEELTGKVQNIERELKPIVSMLNEVERTQSPDSAFFTDQTRAKSGEYGYSPQSSDSDELDLSKLSSFDTNIKDKFNSIDQMSQSMIVDIERRIITDVIDIDEGPKKEKKGFWERNFDSLKRKNKDKKPKSPEKVDIMSQSLNENMFYNNEQIESESPLDRFNSLRNSKKKSNVPIKSNSSSKIPTFAALGKIIKKDSFSRKSRENSIKEDSPENKNRYIKNAKPATENKYKPKVPEKTYEENQLKSVIQEKNTKPNVNNDLSNKSFEEPSRKAVSEKEPRIMHRKSCGDEPNLRSSLTELKKISDSGKIPSQDDIDRISKVTMDAPILSSDADMNTLGKRTMDSLMEIERKRIVMLEEQGCQVIENEREKISELKKRAQDEAKKLCDQKYREKSIDSDSCHLSGEFDRTAQGFDRTLPGFDRSAVEECSVDDSYMTNSAIYEESSGLMASSIEELQVRNSRTESTEDDKRSDDSRPLSNASDFSRDNILSGAPRRSRRGIAPYSEAQRPLTRYLPQDRDDFDLRRHVICAGHQIELCPYVSITPSSCRGYLHKLGAKFHTWSKRWFVFDRESKTFVYYWDKSEKKPRGGAYFQVIEEVYLDHGNTSKSPNPQTTFIVKTRQRRYYLMAPSGEAARIWIDVIFTGAQGYMDYME